MTVETEKQLNYNNKVILAPMVRFGTLPMRLLALEYGAEIVYTEELIDLKLIKSKRRYNSALETTDFVDPSDGTIVFRTCEKEKTKLVLQLGTSNAQRALAVGKLVQNDVAGIDINMGCPKEFSIKGGMGVALLAAPEKAANILRTLCENLNIPVTCKIRILPNLEDTIKLVQKFAATGIAAIAIHARTRDERPQHEPHPDFIREIAKSVNIPVIANGGSRDIQKHADIFKFKELCGANSVMIARAAQLNISIFRKEGLLPIDDVIYRYLKLSIDYDNAAHNSKYCVQSILKELQETPRGKKFLQCQTLQQICEIWNLGEYCYTKQLEFKEKGNFGRREVTPGHIPDVEAPDLKRQKLEVPKLPDDIIEYNIAFIRSNYTTDTQLPKTMLYTYSCQQQKEKPIYETQGIDKLFRAICVYDGKKYTSSFWEKNKKQAEQGAALVCLLSIGVEERKANGRLIAIIVAFLVIFLAIYHAWIRKSAVLAGVLVPAFIMISYGSWVVIQTKRDKQKKALFEKHLKEVAQKNKEELEQKAKQKLAKKSEHKSSTDTTLHFENEVQRKEKSQLNNGKNNSSLVQTTDNSNSNSSSLSSDHRKQRKRRERQRHAATGHEQILIHQTANNELRIKRPSIRQKIFGQKPTQLHYDYVRSMKDKDATTNVSATLQQTKKKKMLQRLNALSGPQLVRTGSAP